MLSTDVLGEVMYLTVQDKIQASYLAKCSPQAAYEWLKETKFVGNKSELTSKIVCLEYNRQFWEYVLSKRREPLIDQGLAEFGKWSKILMKVYLKGDKALKYAALSNPFAFGGIWSWDRLNEDKIIRKLVSSGKCFELEALISNEGLNDEILESFLEKTGPFKTLKKDTYLHLLVKLGKNKRMQTSTESALPNEYDGWTEAQYSHVFKVAWGLTKTLPVNNNYALALHSLLENAPKPYELKNLRETIKRWKKTVGGKKDPNKDTNSGFHWLRSRLADLLPADEALSRSRDFALRNSFYRRFSPSKFEGWEKFFDKDKDNFLSNAVGNENLYTNEENRRKLVDLIFKSKSSWDIYKSWYDYREEEYRKEQPEWFKDEEWQDEEEETPNLLEMENDIKEIKKNLGNLVFTDSAGIKGFVQEKEIIQIRDRLDEMLQNTKTHNNSAHFEEQIEEIKQNLNFLLLNSEKSQPYPTGWFVFGAIVAAGLMYFFG